MSNPYLDPYLLDFDVSFKSVDFSTYAENLESTSALEQSPPAEASVDKDLLLSLPPQICSLPVSVPIPKQEDNVEPAKSTGSYNPPGSMMSQPLGGDLRASTPTPQVIIPTPKREEEKFSIQGLNPFKLVLEKPPDSKSHATNACDISSLAKDTPFILPNQNGNESATCSEPIFESTNSSQLSSMDLDSLESVNSKVPMFFELLSKATPSLVSNDIRSLEADNPVIYPKEEPMKEAAWNGSQFCHTEEPPEEPLLRASPQLRGALDLHEETLRNSNPTKTAPENEWRKNDCNILLSTISSEPLVRNANVKEEKVRSTVSAYAVMKNRVVKKEKGKVSETSERRTVVKLENDKIPVQFEKIKECILELPQFPEPPLQSTTKVTKVEAKKLKKNEMAESVHPKTS